MRAILDTDIVSLIWRQKHPVVRLNASRYLRQYGRFTLTELTYYQARAAGGSGERATG